MIGHALHDALDAAGPQAGHIVHLWWLTVAICTAVFAAVMAALVVALKRAPRAQAGDPPDVSSLTRAEPTLFRAVTAAVAASAVLLMVLLVASIATDRAIASLPGEGALHIEVTGHQWWWAVHYDDAQLDRVFDTANEIHVPVGRPVIVSLESADVIHSFWVPNLHGKKDLIPGHTTSISLRADKPGIYRGQCAEFCGLQHAFMAFEVVASPPAEYEAWAQAQRRPAAEPSDAQAQHGKELFMSGTCMLCHAIDGTTAGARMAPNLTHVASRRTLAAGTLENTPQNLAAWILDPQKAKPGAQMPAHPLDGSDLGALVAYLETLK
ncbi:MAG TPA: cytochrome c oxidase subunit II [Usitatibacter sp.]|jgi:cytochrome c oxidase subunit 2|nr:cytochrome c oxidase subunit II [Usitatibacter sp.]